MLLDNIYDYLVAKGAVDAGWALYLSYLPDDTDQVIGLFETGGFPADTMMRENERVTFQVRVRTSRLDYQVGRAKWKQIFDLLQDAQASAGSPHLLTGITFIQALHFGPLTFLDDKGRNNFSSNWKVLQVRS